MEILWLITLAVALVVGVATFLKNRSNGALVKIQVSYKTNIFAINWANYSSGHDSKIPDYCLAAKAAPLVGEVAGGFAVEIIRETGGVPYKTIFVGHSLGAHLLSAASRRVFQVLKSLPKVIYGLDPARPLFSGRQLYIGLRSTDAWAVIIYVTDGGCFGTDEAIGTYNIILNKGSRPQPACLVSKWYSIPEWIKKNEITGCSHSYSITAFASGIIEFNDHGKYHPGCKVSKLDDIAKVLVTRFK